MALLLLCICVYGIVFDTTECSSVKEEQRIIRSLFDPSTYNPAERPSGVESPDLDDPTIVYFNMFIRNVESVDVKNMDFTMDVTFRQQWLDPRLTHNHSSHLTLPSEDLAWAPDTFFRNEKEAVFHQVPNKQFYVRVFPDGNVLQSMRVTLKLHCGMNLRKYPFDSQTCMVQIASYSASKQSLEYVWKSSDPIQMTTHLHLQGMTMMKFFSDTCDVITATAEYSCLSAGFVMKREASFHV